MFLEGFPHYNNLFSNKHLYNSKLGSKEAQQIDPEWTDMINFCNKIAKLTLAAARLVKKMRHLWSKCETRSTFPLPPAVVHTRPLRMARVINYHFEPLFQALPLPLWRLSPVLASPWPVPQPPSSLLDCWQPIPAWQTLAQVHSLLLGATMAGTTQVNRVSCSGTMFDLCPRHKIVKLMFMSLQSFCSSQVEYLHAIQCRYYYIGMLHKIQVADKVR